MKDRVEGISKTRRIRSEDQGEQVLENPKHTIKAPHFPLQIVDLLARQNGLMRDRQLLAKEVEFLRSQLVTPLNLADCEKGDMREGPVEDLLRKVRVEDLVPPVSGN